MLKYSDFIKQFTPEQNRFIRRVLLALHSDPNIGETDPDNIVRLHRPKWSRDQFFRDGDDEIIGQRLLEAAWKNLHLTDERDLIPRLFADYLSDRFEITHDLMLDDEETEYSETYGWDEFAHLYESVKELFPDEWEEVQNLTDQAWNEIKERLQVDGKNELPLPSEWYRRREELAKLKEKEPHPEGVIPFPKK